MIGFELFIYVFGFVGWLEAFRMRGQRNDAYADISKLAYDYEVEYDELRRTHGHKKIELRFDGDTDE